MVTEVVETAFKTGKKVVETEINEAERAAEQAADNGSNSENAGYKTAKDLENTLKKATTIVEKTAFNHWGKTEEYDKCQEIEY
jgi:transcription elongation GreA/GreB family factor